jgi:hypothetical protein
MILETIATLPCELREIIFSYIHIKEKRNVTRELFISEYINKVKEIPLYQSYVRYIIRNNHFFIYNLNITINYNHWLNIKNWKYDNMIFNNYILYIKYYSELNNVIIYQDIKKRIKIRAKKQHGKIH